MKRILNIDDKKLHLVLNNYLWKWDEIYGINEENWSFPIEELLDGTIEINEDIWYWLIDGRCYETDEEVIN